MKLSILFNNRRKNNNKPLLSKVNFVYRTVFTTTDNDIQSISDEKIKEFMLRLEEAEKNALPPRVEAFSEVQIPRRRNKDNKCDDDDDLKKSKSSKEDHAVQNDFYNQASLQEQVNSYCEELYGKGKGKVTDKLTTDTSSQSFSDDEFSKHKEPLIEDSRGSASTKFNEAVSNVKQSQEMFHEEVDHISRLRTKVDTTSRASIEILETAVKGYGYTIERTNAMKKTYDSLLDRMEIYLRSLKNPGRFVKWLAVGATVGGIAWQMYKHGAFPMFGNMLPIISSILPLSGSVMPGTSSPINNIHITLPPSPAASQSYSACYRFMGQHRDI